MKDDENWKSYTSCDTIKENYKKNYKYTKDDCEFIILKIDLELWEKKLIKLKFEDCSNDAGWTSIKINVHELYKYIDNNDFNILYKKCYDICYNYK